jgi:hypothetical protein
LISSSEVVKGAKVRILVRKNAGGKFKKKTFEVGDIVYLKTIPAEAWENNSFLILVTEDGKDNSESYGFHPEDLELVK